MKRWPIVLGGVALLIAALVGGGFFLISRLDAKALIEQAVYEQTGRKLTIAGAVHPAFFPTLGVHANDVTLANIAGGEAPALLSADEIQIGVTAQALLDRDLDVTRLVFVNPRLSLERDAQGRANWILTPVKPQKPTQQSSPDAGVREVRLKGARIEGGVISYVNRQSGLTYGLQDLNAAVSLPSLAGPLGVDGAGTFNGEKVDFALKLTGLRATLSGGASPLAVSLKSTPLNAAFDGALDAKTGGLTGLLEASGPSLRRMTAWIGAPIGEGSMLQAFAVNGRFTLGPKRASFENASLKLDAIEGRGDFLLETGRAKPVVSGRLELMALDLNPYLAPAPQAGGAAPVGRIESVDVAAPAGWSRNPIDLSGLKAIDANLDLTTGPLTALKVKLDRAKLDLVIHDGFLAATLSEIALYGGSGKGRIELDARAPDLRLRQQLDVTGIDAARFLADAAGFTSLEGRSALKLDLASVGRDQQALASSTDGSLSISLTEGALRGVNLGGISRTIRTALDGRMIGANARTPFKTFSTSFVVSDGVAATDDLRIRAADAEITAAGVIDLGQRTLDMRIRPKADSVLSRLGIAPGAGIATPFRVQGSWSKLTYKTDLLGGARDTIAQQIQTVRVRAQMSLDAPK